MKNNKTSQKQNYSKYLFAGVIVAVIVFVIFSLADEGEVPGSKNTVRVWSAETDSNFVKDCYSKYKPQIKDDMEKQETMKMFCRCMLEKIKSRYDETELNRIKDNEIKVWDKECREKISNSNPVLK